LHIIIINEAPTEEGVYSQNSETNRWRYVGLEALAAVVMKSIIFSTMAPCSQLKVNQLFGATYRLHKKYQRESKWQAQSYSYFCSFSGHLGLHTHTQIYFV
jgi:hypothetical protein